MGLQTIARKAIASVLPQNGTNPSVALVAIDTQKNPGAVLAMIGGANYHQSQFNLATQGERQPGSAFKPFVFATALKEGISPLEHAHVEEAGGDQHRRQARRS